MILTRWSETVLFYIADTTHYALILTVRGAPMRGEGVQDAGSGSVHSVGSGRHVDPALRGGWDGLPLESDGRTESGAHRGTRGRRRRTDHCGQVAESRTPGATNRGAALDGGS